jgi:acetoin utilization deacetylase AcuC-like enzyme
VELAKSAGEIFINKKKMETPNQIKTKKMNFIYDPKVLAHDTGNYPENRKRIEAFGALQICNVPDGEPFLSLIHDEDYIQIIKEKCERGEAIDEDTVVSPGSFWASCQVAASAVLAAQTGNFALVRPPGHHAF